MDSGRKRVVDDLAGHAAAKMTANLHDALALLDDPEERLALTKGVSSTCSESALVWRCSRRARTGAIRQQ
jgi:hypothetical protein